MKESNVIVTGGAGFVGSHTSKALSRAGFRPVTIDNLSTGFPEAVKWGPFEQVNLQDEEHLANVFKKYSPLAVIHLAASIEAGESMRLPLEFYHNNVLGALTLLRVMQQTSVEKIVFSSTASVYGEPKTTPIPETHPLRPINPYGRSKLIIEEVLRDVSAARNLRYCVFRYFNAAGADPEGEIGENHTPETHLIPLILQSAYGLRSDFKIFGADYDTPDGTCIRDYVHVSDIADAHVLALRRLLSGGENLVANLGTGTGHSVREVCKTVELIVGHAISAPEVDRRPGDPAMLIADSTHAMHNLGWSPKHALLATIVETASNWIRARNSLLQESRRLAEIDPESKQNANIIHQIPAKNQIQTQQQVQDAPQYLRIKPTEDVE